MTHGISTIRRTVTAACVALLLSAPGCTSALSTAYLRDALWNGSDHAAETGASAGDDAPAVVETSAADPADTEAADAARRAAAIDEAVARLAKLEGLDDEARAALLATLETTQQEDWPVVIETFAESLGPRLALKPAEAPTDAEAEAAEEPTETVATDLAAEPTEPSVVALAEPAEPTPSPERVIRTAVAARDDAANLATVEPAEVVVAPAKPREVTPPTAAAVAVAARPTLAVRNACFARKVVAWGDVDRFPAARFQPGQDVIVYFELDELTSGTSPAGHTTCVDTALRLVAADGTQLHAWSFEPLAETRRTPRRDYFARYVVTIPPGMPIGPCRVEVAVTDTLANTTATALLPLEIID